MNREESVAHLLNNISKLNLLNVESPAAWSDIINDYFYQSDSECDSNDSDSESNIVDEPDQNSDYEPSILRVDVVRDIERENHLMISDDPGDERVKVEGHK